MEKNGKMNSYRMNLADRERYRRYHNAKAKIPMNLPPAEYEAEIKRLARKYKV